MSLLFSTLASLILATCIGEICSFKLKGCKKTITVDYMAQCKNEPNMTVAFKDFVVLQTSKDGYAFNGKIEFLEEVGSPWKLNFVLLKYKSKDNPNSCETLFKLNIDKICDKLPQKNQIWSGFVEEMKLDTKCPIQPKLYPIENIEIGEEAMAFLPINSGFHKLVITGTSKNKKIICVEIEFTMGCK